MQACLRREPARIGGLVKETLRYDAPAKVDFRLARTTTAVAGIAVPAGSW